VVSEEMKSVMFVFGWFDLTWIHTLKPRSSEKVSCLLNLRIILTDILSEKESGREVGFDTTLRNRTLHKGISPTNSLPEHSRTLPVAFA